MTRPRYIQFTDAEVSDFDDLERQLYELSEFLWTDPRPQAEGKFDMEDFADGWDFCKDDAQAALAKCGTAACACGWEALRTGDKLLYDNVDFNSGPYVSEWLFSDFWPNYDNTPFGASYRITHFLKHKDAERYATGDFKELMRLNYPDNPFWLTNPEAKEQGQ